MRKVLGILLIMCVSVFQAMPVFSQAAYEVSNFIETLEVGSPVNYQNLTIIPVYATRVYDNTNYTTLDEALNRGWLTISEMGGGNVNEVMISNHSGRYIYIMGGEILTGCRQDRIVSKDVLIGPRRYNVRVPVYCVEEGRWTAESDRFYSKNNLGTHRLRAVAQKAEYNAQSSIWDSVRGFNSSLSVRSHTQAYQDAYEDRGVRSRVVAYEEKLQYVPGLNRDTVGVVVAVGGEIVSADIFANPQIFKKLWPKILRSSAFSTINCTRGGYVSQRQAADFLSGLRHNNYYRVRAIDLGDELSASTGANVNALVYRNSVLHLAAFNDYSPYYGQRQRDNHNGRIPVIRR
ncbi:MAG: hypothetical protein PHP17_07825 [Candidatus Omnitrophica bacterium]|nr:hypothetical protein [Candidatus Omnitrophota bacterium]